MNDDPRWLEDSNDRAHRQLRQALDEGPRWTHSEVRQRRIWTRVATAATSVRATRKAFLTGAVVASLLTLTALVSFELVRRHVGDDSADATATAPTLEGTGTTASATDQLAAPPATEMARPGDVIETAAGERRTRDLPQGAHAEVLPSSILAVDETGRPLVRKGQVRFQVAHQPPGERFTVRMGTYRVVVVGTRFVVSAREGRLGVAVEEGTVEIWRDRRIARLVRGQTWAGADPGGPDTTARAARARAPAAATVEPALLAARAELDPRRALALYATIAQGEGPSAENALYEMASIYQDKLGQPREALAVWERYRSRFPRGLLRAETDLSIVDTLAGLGENGRALTEAAAFLKRYPQTERRGEVARVAGDLSRARGDCQNATTYYGAVLAGRADGDDADDAVFGRAACLQQLGDPAAADLLRRYLAQHPRGRHTAEATRLLR